MKRTALKRSPFRRKPPKRDPEHVAATALAHVSACLVCERTGTCVPAHWPHHRRRRESGGVWDRRNWVPLCGQPGACHQLIDRQLGTSEAVESRRQDALCILENSAQEWWDS